MQNDIAKLSSLSSCAGECILKWRGKYCWKTVNKNVIFLDCKEFIELSVIRNLLFAVISFLILNKELMF
jgi:hypothetical protein